MTDGMKQQVTHLLDQILAFEGITPDEIPGIDVYMDQLTTFMERRLKEQTRRPGTDKVLTKTMINNYTKNDLLPPPVKKKYTREHLILLIYIFYYKNNLSMRDIHTLIAPLKELFDAGEQTSADLDLVYRETLKTCKGLHEGIRESVSEALRSAEESFEEVSGPERKRLQRFMLLALLLHDVYTKQSLIERLIDTMEEKEDPGTKKKEKNKEKKNAGRAGKDTAK